MEGLVYYKLCVQVAADSSEIKLVASMHITVISDALILKTIDCIIITGVSSVYVYKF